VSGGLLTAVAAAFFSLGFALGGVAQRHLDRPLVVVSKTRMPPAERIYPFASPLGCDARIAVMAAGVVYHQACYVRTNPQVWL
jgi:hypothetical protein